MPSSIRIDVGPKVRTSLYYCPKARALRADYKVSDTDCVSKSVCFWPEAKKVPAPGSE